MQENVEKPMIVEQCFCGCDTFELLVRFVDGEIAGYFTKMKCHECKAEWTAPTPIDGSSNETM